LELVFGEDWSATGDASDVLQAVPLLTEFDHVTPDSTPRQGDTDDVPYLECGEVVGNRVPEALINSEGRQPGNDPG
jgi:hypothetical protein